MVRYIHKSLQHLTNCTCENVLLDLRLIVFPAGGVNVLGVANVTFKACSFVENMAADGAGLAGSGTAAIDMSSTTLANNRAHREGGGVFLSGTSEMTVSMSTLQACVAQFDGGGMSTRDESKVTLNDGVSICQCQAIYGKGGGLLAAGASVTIQAKSHSLVMEDNRAVHGGGMCYMASVSMNGQATTVIQGNVASDGGGIFGFSRHKFSKVLSMECLCSEHVALVAVCGPEKVCKFVWLPLSGAGAAVNTCWKILFYCTREGLAQDLFRDSANTKPQLRALTLENF